MRKKEGKMEPRPLTRNFLSPVLFYTILVWTAFCTIGTWFIILNYGIIQNGLIAVITTLFFGIVIWAIPFSGLVLLYLSIIPSAQQTPGISAERTESMAFDEGLPY